MKTLLVSIFSLVLFLGDTPTAPAVNSKAIPFDLKNTDDKNISLNSFKDSKGIILTFLTNECPYAQVYQGRVKALQEKYDSIKGDANDIMEKGKDTAQNFKDKAADVKKTYA